MKSLGSLLRGAGVNGVCASFLTMTLGAMAMIWFHVAAASRDNHAAVLHERAVMQLQMLLRGLNEAIVTEASLGSLESIDKSLATFEQTRRTFPGQDTDAILAKWNEIDGRIRTLMTGRRNTSFDVDGLIGVGKVSSEIDAIAKAMLERAEGKRDKAEDAEKLLLAVILACCLFISVATLSSLWAFKRGVARPIDQAIRDAARVAEGDLTIDASRRDSGQAGRLLTALGHMTRRLGEMVSHVRNGTDNIRQAAGQLVDGNRELSRRTEQQATALEETASSMEELSAAVSENANNARQASEQARLAMGVAVKGGDVVGRFSDRMQSIQQSSRRIADITGVIDGIAFQTNILALNAAVEAARAGDQGRGFAVVAAEVRVLAQRSATAAKEIKTLIQESREQVEAGAGMAESTRATMSEVSQAIEQACAAIEQISRASADQANGIRQVNGAIVQLDQTIQQNSSLVEEIAVASQALFDQAEVLRDQVKAFRTAEQASAVPLQGGMQEGAGLNPNPRARLPAPTS